MEDPRKPPRVIKYRRPIEPKQIWGIARMLIIRDPTLSESEWKAQIKETAAKQGYGEPSTDTLNDAMTQVERVVFKGKSRQVKEP